MPREKPVRQPGEPLDNFTVRLTSWLANRVEQLEERVENHTHSHPYGRPAQLVRKTDA